MTAAGLPTITGQAARLAVDRPLLNLVIIGRKPVGAELIAQVLAAFPEADLGVLFVLAGGSARPIRQDSLGAGRLVRCMRRGD
jgi:hypothetical protein